MERREAEERGTEEKGVNDGKRGEEADKREAEHTRDREEGKESSRQFARRE